jgi:hypothetical protein
VVLPAGDHNHMGCFTDQVKLIRVIPDFMPIPSTHRMHDTRSIVPHIWPKVFTDNPMLQIKYNYYINNVSKDYDDSQRSETAEDSITPKE